MTAPKILRRIIEALTPYYDWGQINTVRMDARTYAEQTEAEVRFFEIQWVGPHFGIQIGRTPPKATAEEMAWREARI